MLSEQALEKEMQRRCCVGVRAGRERGEDATWREDFAVDARLRQQRANRTGSHETGVSEMRARDNEQRVRRERTNEPRAARQQKVLIAH